MDFMRDDDFHQVVQFIHRNGVNVVYFFLSSSCYVAPISGNFEIVGADSQSSENLTFGDSS